MAAEPLSVLGWKLMVARKRAKVNQEQAAYAVGVTRQTLGMWEAGKAAPPFLKVAHLAAYYRVDLADLADPAERMPKGVSA